MPQNQILANIYCALYTLAEGGGGGTGNVVAGAPLVLNQIVIGQGGFNVATTNTPDIGAATGSTLALESTITVGTGLTAGSVEIGDGGGGLSTIQGSAGVTGFFTLPFSGNQLGYLNIPQNVQAGNYSTVLEDSGKHIMHASGAGAGDTYTIDGAVAYVIGTAITFVNLDSNNLSIAISTDTLVFAGAGTTGTRTLAQYGIATAIKTGAGTWLISGTNLT